MTYLTKTLFLVALGGLFLAAGFVGGPSSDVETRAMQWMAAIRADWPGLTPMAGGITNLGSAYVTLGAASIGSLWLLLRRAPTRALLLALTVLAERLLVDGLKDWIGRPRPGFGVDWLPQRVGFPSGHAANSMTAFLATALIVAVPRHRKPWVAGALLMTFIVGLTRIYLGVHWPSDVIGGWALGLLCVAAALAIGRRSGVLEQQHQIVGRHVPALREDEAT